MWAQLRAGFDSLRSNPDVRAVLVRGEGGHFCAGGDIAEYADFRFEEASLKAFHEDLVWPALAAMLDCDQPVLAQIEGNCMGAGVEIACCCDLRLAGQSARFGAPIARLGFPMAPREAALVARVAGMATLREMLLAARLLDAPLLAQRGFLSEVLADDALPDAALAWAARLVALSPQAATMNKQMLRSLVAPSGQPSQAAHEGAYAYADSAEHREGIAAFVEKRQPRF